MSYRVIQWASGNVGRASLRAIAAHPALDLVGLLVYSDKKAGRDAGELCKQPPMGVVATDDVEKIVALDADCVLHMPLPSARYGDDPGRDLRDICRLLESGKNVITTVGYVYPRAYGMGLVEQLEKACAVGGVSLHGTGVNPGWMAEVLPLTMSALCARIDRIYVLESTNFSFYPSPEVIFDMMGLGKSVHAFEAESERYRGWLSGLFCESVGLIAEGLSLELDEIRTHADVREATETFAIAAGTIRRGTIAGQRFRWEGIAEGVTRIVLEAVYRAESRVAPDWPEAGGAIRVEGRPSVSFRVDEDWITNGLLGTAMHAVHAVPTVCDAEPGIRTFLDLPLITGRHTVPRPPRA